MSALRGRSTAGARGRFIMISVDGGSNFLDIMWYNKTWTGRNTMVYRACM